MTLALFKFILWLLVTAENNPWGLWFLSPTTLNMNWQIPLVMGQSYLCVQCGLRACPSNVADARWKMWALTHWGMGWGLLKLRSLIFLLFCKSTCQKLAWHAIGAIIVRVIAKNEERSGMEETCLVTFTPPKFKAKIVNSLQWRHNEYDDVSNHWRLDCLLIVYSGPD